MVPRHALVLFDSDGFTSVVPSRNLTSEVELTESLQCTCSHGRASYKVEILKLSDSKPELNRFLADWESSSRALSIEEAMKDNKVNGFLAIEFEQENEPRDGQASNQEQVEASQNSNEENNVMELANLNNEETATTLHTGIITGSKGRKVNVLHQGSGQRGQDGTTPKRRPFFTEGLNIEQVDVVNGCLTDFERGMKTISTQTEPVLIFTNKSELLASYDPKDRTIEQLHEKLDSQHKSVSNKLSQILEILGNSNIERDISQLLREGILNLTSTPVRCTSMNEAPDVVANVRDTESLVEEPSHSSEAFQVETMESSLTFLSQEPATLEVKDVVISDSVFSNVVPSSTPSEVPVVQNCVASSEVPEVPHSVASSEVPVVSTHYAVPFMSENTFPMNYAVDKPYSVLMKCKPGPFVEIQHFEDMNGLNEQTEVRVSGTLLNSMATLSSWPGSFAWQVAQRIYSKDEILGRNFHGKLGKAALSPRRRHAIEHALIAFYSDSVDVVKQGITGINTGIRNMNRQRKGARKPLFHLQQY